MTKQEQLERAAATRAANKAQASELGFPVRSRVRVNTPRERTYHGREGTVSEWNDGEFVVNFGSRSASFLPSELERVSTSR